MSRPPLHLSRRRTSRIAKAFTSAPRTAWLGQVLAAALVLATAAIAALADSPRAPDVRDVSDRAKSSGVLAQGGDGKLLIASGARIRHEAGSLEKLGSFFVGLGYGAEAFDSAALCVLRFSARGALDAGFGKGGAVVTPLSPPRNRDRATVTALLQDGMGRATVVGWRYLSTALDANVPVITAARYTARGELDASFGERGVVTTRVDQAAVTQALAATLDRDGRLLVAGYSGGSKLRNPRGSFDDWPIRAILLRYTLNGELDTSFGDGGIASYVLEPSGQDGRQGRDFLLYDYEHIKTAGLILDRLGRSVVAVSGGEGPAVLLRYTPEGRLDPSFGTTGVVRTPMGKGSGISTLLWDSTGRLLAVGTSADSMVIARYFADGVLDSAFGERGTRRTPIGAGMRVSAALQESDHHLLVVASGERGVQLARYDAEGLLDRSFGSNGVIHTAPDKRLATAAGLTIDDEGVPTVAALSEDGIFLVRFDRAGPVDLSFRSMTQARN